MPNNNSNNNNFQQFPTTKSNNNRVVEFQQSLCYILRQDYPGVFKAGLTALKRLSYSERFGVGRSWISFQKTEFDTHIV